MRSFAITLLFTAACAMLRPTPNEPKGPWRELTSEHFVVWTNTSPARAQRLMREMENLRQVVLGVSFFKRDIPGKSFVLAFHELSEVHEYMPEQFIAQAWSARNVLRQPIIVLAAKSLDDDREIVTHELTHVISHNVIANQPAWFAEGMAGFFETVRLDENRSTIELGAPLPGRFAYIRQSGLTPISAVFACEQNACKDDRFYATTWALMTYLLNEHPDQMLQYMERLTQTSATEQAQIWAAVFPNLPPKKLDHELASWVRYGRHRVMKYKVALREWSVAERPITEADVLAAKGVLRYFDAPHTISSELKRSLALDPTNVVANMIHEIMIAKSTTREKAQAITAAHPDDWRAWWLAWRAAQTGAEAREAREKTCGLVAQNFGVAVVKECAAPPPPPAETKPPTEAKPPGEDPRYQVFVAAMPQINACLKKSKAKDVAANFSIDIDIADSGAVTAARVSLGSAAANACAEAVLKNLTFPPHHAGTYHLGKN